MANVPSPSSPGQVGGGAQRVLLGERAHARILRSGPAFGVPAPVGRGKEMARSRGEAGARRRTGLPTPSRGRWTSRVALLVGLLAASAAPGAILDADEVQAEYRQILSTLSSGAAEAALDRLVEFEVDVLAGDLSPRRVEALWRQKLRVLRVLLESQPLELLEPVILLHHDQVVVGVELQRLVPKFN